MEIHRFEIKASAYIIHSLMLLVHEFYRKFIVQKLNATRCCANSFSIIDDGKKITLNY